jgi:hypothetical protein
LQVRRSKASKRCQRDERPKGGRPADEQVPFTFSGTDALHDADEKRKGTHTSIIAGEAGQRHHVMYHYRMYLSWRAAGKERCGRGRGVRDRPAVARSRAGEDGVWHQSQKRSISPGGRPGMRS